MDSHTDPVARHEIGDTVILNFFHCGKLSTCTIAGVKYTDYGKVLYDITLRPFYNEGNNQNLVTILKDIDSYFVKTEYDELINKTT